MPAAGEALQSKEELQGDISPMTPAEKLDRGFFGHPKGLQTLFITEMWERMSYYGMRGFLVLFMTTAIVEGGLAIGSATAVAIYGLYTASVYFLGLPGGWIADRMIGSQKAVWYGGIIIMCGHLVLAIPSHPTFFIGLILVAIGTGLLKPNISAMVGQLYNSEDERRDSGYALYYMGINIGSIIGYIVCGGLAEKVGWHFGFGAAAVGMALGLIVFYKTTSHLKGAGALPAAPMGPKGQRNGKLGILFFALGLAAVTALMLSGILKVDPIRLSKVTAVVFLIIFAVYFSWIYFGGNLNKTEKKGMLALLLICVASTMFWSGFEQAGTSFNLFTRDFVDRDIFGWEFPTSWFQSINSWFIVILSPFFAYFWLWLGRRLVTPAYGIKCAIGLIIMGLGFIVMVYAAKAASGGNVTVFWLLLVYFLHTVGELFLSPIALSAVSKLSPPRYMSQMMGVFVLTYSIGNIVAGIIAGGFDSENIEAMPNIFKLVATFAIGVGAVVFLVGMFTKGWEKEVEVANNAKSIEPG